MAWHANNPPAEEEKHKTGMRIEAQWDTYFLGYICMDSVHEVDSVITDASVAVFSRYSVRNITEMIIRFL